VDGYAGFDMNLEIMTLEELERYAFVHVSTPLENALYSALLESFGVLEAENSDSSMEIDNLSKQNDKLEKQVAYLEDTIGKLEDQLADCHARVATLEDEKQALADLLEELEAA
jgi:chromosome segregation ATPase